VTVLGGEFCNSEAMPSPVGHSLMGYIIYRTTGKSGQVRSWPQIVACLFGANAPDLDFVPGLIVGDLGRFHQGPSHSTTFAILFALVACPFFSRPLRAFVIGFSLYLSHVLLDYLVQDPTAPLGVPLFWPLSDRYYMAPFAFLSSFDRPDILTVPAIPAFFTFHNFLTISIEVLCLLPLLLFVSAWRKKSDFKAALFKENSPIHTN
jgi:inner membrane protein